jgi:hypothetical protein
MYVKATMLKAWKASYSNSRILETREEKILPILREKILSQGVVAISSKA